MKDCFLIDENCILKVFKMKFSYFTNYTYVLYDKIHRDALIIDPAWDIDALSSFLDDEELIPGAIMLTHSHFDHTNLVDELVSRYDCTVYMSEKEKNYYNFKCKNLVSLRENEHVKWRNKDVYVISTPGHTVGSLCYMIDNVMFTGDTLFIESCGICNTNGGSYHSMFKSLNFLKNQIPDDVRIFPGHHYKKEPGELFANVKNGFNFMFKSEESFVKFRKTLDSKINFQFPNKK